LVAVGVPGGYRLLLRYHVGLLGDARRVLGLADASALHQHVILASQRHRAEGNDQEKVGHIGLRTLAPNHIALGGPERYKPNKLMIRRSSYNGSGILIEFFSKQSTILKVFGIYLIFVDKTKLN